jgi:hypothetical protein
MDGDNRSLGAHETIHVSDVAGDDIAFGVILQENRLNNA